MTSPQPAKVALVTGGSTGIGLACVERLRADGARVLALANDEASVAPLRDRADPDLRAITADVRRSADLRAAVAMCEEVWGGLDTLVCCAGIQRYGTVESTPEDVLDDVLAVNLKGVFLAAGAAVPALRRRGGGAIVAISSVQAFASQSNVAAYTASKGAVNALVRAMALDHAADGITVNAVCPASVDTPMLRHSAALFRGDGTAEAVMAGWGRAHPIGRIGRPEEVAALVAFLVGPEARFITGADLKIDGGALAKIGIVLPE